MTAPEIATAGPEIHTETRHTPTPETRITPRATSRDTCWSADIWDAWELCRLALARDEDFTERAAILEHDAGMSRDAAEREACRLVYGEAAAHG